jgi:hypothetical protein
MLLERPKGGGISEGLALCRHNHIHPVEEAKKGE